DPERAVLRLRDGRVRAGHALAERRLALAVAVGAARGAAVRRRAARAALRRRGDAADGADRDGCMLHGLRARAPPAERDDRDADRAEERGGEPARRPVARRLAAAAGAGARERGVRAPADEPLLDGA